MKAMILDKKSEAGLAHRRRPGATLIATVAIWACTAIGLDAVLIDDFENGVKWAQGGGGTNYFVWGLTNGQMVISRQNPIPTPNPGVLTTYDSVYWPPPIFPESNLEAGRTLELRMDLIRASTDDLFLMVGPGGRHSDGADSAYFVLIDRNEVALMKYKYPGGMTSFYWDFLLTTNENVTVGIAITKTNISLAITVKIVAKGNERVTLYERTFVDGPGQDGPVPPPDPHGYGFFGPDLGVPYTNFTYAAVGCSQLIFSNPPPLEMLLDNLEYDVYHPPHLEIARAGNGVDLVWKLPLEEHIVVAATNLSAPWCPCPQAYTLTSDRFCLTLPCQSPQQFFKLTPGRQFTDEFSTLVPTWATWFQEAGEEWIVTNGVLKCSSTDQPQYRGFALCPLGATNDEAVLRDFHASVDILEWVTNGNSGSTFAIAGRGHVISPNSATAYFGGLNLNYNGVGSLRPWISGKSTTTSAPDFSIQEIPLPYRLQFSAVGNKISLRVLKLRTGELIRELSLTDSAYSTGMVGLWINGEEVIGNSYTITLDNFVLIGTKP